METTKVKERIAELKEDKPGKSHFITVLKLCLSFITGLILMNPSVIGQLSPYAISFVAACDGVYAFTASCGAFIGAMLFFDGTSTVKYIAVILLLLIIEAVSRRYPIQKLRKYARFINAFLANFVISTAIIAATGFDPEEFAVAICESIICLAGTLVFSRAAELIDKIRYIATFNTTDYISIVVSFFILLMPFYKYSILFFSPVSLIFCIAIMAVSKIKKASGGMIAGICAGAAIGLSGEVNFLSLAYALSGMLCGEFSRRSKIISSLSFMAPLVTACVVDGTLHSYGAVIEGATACGLMLLIPDNIFERVSRVVNQPLPVFVKSESRHDLAHRMNKISIVFKDISNCVDKVQKTLDPLIEPPLTEAIKNGWEKVCSQCELYESCRSEIKNPSEDTLLSIAQVLSDNISLDEKVFPDKFSDFCYSFEEMKNEVRHRYLQHTAELGAKGKISQLQGLMSDQFVSMAEILNDIASDFDEETNISTQIADSCAKEAKEFGLDVISASSHTNHSGRTFIDLNVSSLPEAFDSTRLSDTLSDLSGYRLGPPEIEQKDECTVLRFSQKASISIDIFAFSRSKDENKICGDYYRIFHDSNNNTIALLSDGMGTGTRAAVDSAMAAEVFTKLIKSGLTPDCALPISNSALLVKSEDESLATLDIVQINPYTKVVDFYKAGAAATFIKNRDKVAILEQSSLPLGILRDIEFSKAQATLEQGDIILMLSDGVMSIGSTWVQQELKLWDNDNPSELAHYIVNSACERRKGMRMDDMTAIVLMIK